MTEQETAFYRNFYKILCNEETNNLLKKYATSQLDKHLRVVRASRDMNEIQRANGCMDAWNDIINLKEHITKIMREIS